MAAANEHAELVAYLRGASGPDLLSVLPIVSANFETTAVLHVLRSSCLAIERSVRRLFDRRITVAAFGSIGRREYVPGASDLDSVIIVEGDLTPQLRRDVRDAILTPLAVMNPWLSFDHGEYVTTGRWDAIDNVDVPYPVVGTCELYADADARSDLLDQRRWQVLLEARPIFDRQFFHEVYERLLPQTKRTSGLEINFSLLASDAGLFFGVFDNPLYLFKSASKYFKTRFLREFFVFATEMVFITGFYTQQSGERLHTKYIRASTVNKLMRSVSLAEQLDREGSGNRGLTLARKREILNILSVHGIAETEILRYGAHYDSMPARYVHGLLMSILSQFNDCWAQVYDPSTRAMLERVPKNISLESNFPQKVNDRELARVLTALKARRDSYKRYMSATAEVVQKLFIKRQDWNGPPAPRWIGTSSGDV